MARTARIDRELVGVERGSAVEHAIPDTPLSEKLVPFERLASDYEIGMRDGVGPTQATISFGREEPDAANHAMEAQRAKVTPAATSLVGAQGQAAIRQFESKVNDLRRSDPTLDAADAIARVSAAHPDLARAYTVALSVPVIGGVSMVSA